MMNSNTIEFPTVQLLSFFQSYYISLTFCNILLFTMFYEIHI